MSKQTINTVNVIEMWQGQIQNLASFPETKEGNGLAEARFRAIVREKTRHKEREIETLVEDGIAEHELFTVVIFHSTV